MQCRQIGVLDGVRDCVVVWGCANRSGNLSAHGYTEDDMIAYNLQNPIPQIVKPLAFRADKTALEDLADRLNAYKESKRNEQSTNKD